MARAEYYVLPDGARWKIHHDGRDYHYPSRETALKAAIYTAYGSGRLGYEAEVLVHGPDGAWQCHWAYGRDPYPPKD
jgi:hypothetical protein